MSIPDKVVKSFKFPEDEKITIVAPSKSAAVNQALTFPVMAAKIIVADPESLDKAAFFLQEVKAMAVQVEQTFDPQIYQANRLHKSLLAEKKKFTEPLEKAEKIVKLAIGKYYEEQDRKKREAEEERKRVEVQAMKEAEELESKAVSAKTQEEKEKIVCEMISTLETASELGKEITDAAAPPKVQGLAVSESWKFEIVDEGEIPREYLIPDIVKIGKVVRALKGDAKIPGVWTWAEKSVSSRAL